MIKATFVFEIQINDDSTTASILLDLDEVLRERAKELIKAKKDPETALLLLNTGTALITSYIRGLSSEE
ncbi:hypothetical protein V0288_05240 [Pannus brasiliensis CCIBt3594]|uniref:Uncharacterized protein n=1 Tax=Pannus brasiliensis CCIBt3594 TaxID=1427578 RepID=A0AAW9QS88_9CHRO